MKPPQVGTQLFHGRQLREFLQEQADEIDGTTVLLTDRRSVPEEFAPRLEISSPHDRLLLTLGPLRAVNILVCTISFL